MSHILDRGAATGQVRYQTPEDGVLVYLISASVNGALRRRLAARYILDCLRSHRTPEETEACLHELEETELFQLADDVREMTSKLGLN